MIRTKIMSFILNSSSPSCGRKGVIKLNELKYETPLIFQYSRNGSLPHLDWNLCQRYLNDDNAPLLTPLSTCIGMTSYLRSLKVDMRRFCCIPKERASFVSVYDPLKPAPSGFNWKGGISVWTPGGRTRLSPYDFSQVLSLLKPDGFQSLCDSDTPVDASKKRLDNSVKRTIGYLDQVIAQNHHSTVFGSIEGGFDLKSRLISVELTKERQIDGFVFEGLTDHVKDNEELEGLTDHVKDNELKKLIKLTIEEIPEDKPRAVFGCLRPEEIHSLIKLGFDLFDSSYATFLSEKGQALLIDYQPSGDQHGPITTSSVLDLKESGFKEAITTSSVLDLTESGYKEDFSIISKDCRCYSCQKGFTKGYLNHLLNCKEMSATVLLMLHNLHVLYEWMDKLKNEIH